MSASPTPRSTPLGSAASPVLFCPCWACQLEEVKLPTATCPSNELEGDSDGGLNLWDGGGARKAKGQEGLVSRTAGEGQGQGQGRGRGDDGAEQRRSVLVSDVMEVLFPQEGEPSHTRNDEIFIALTDQHHTTGLGIQRADTRGRYRVTYRSRDAWSTGVRVPAGRPSRPSNEANSTSSA